jgi:hypothetical protein
MQSAPKAIGLDTASVHFAPVFTAVITHAAVMSVSSTVEMTMDTLKRQPSNFFGIAGS